MLDDVAEAIITAANTAIMPRFQLLQHSQVHEKSPGDYVTIADHECEALITEKLQRIAPGVPVLGEEAAAHDPKLIERLQRQDRFWLVDPLDGTRAFIAGDTDFAVMVALVEDGQTCAAWIWQPIPELMFTARRGEGAFRQGIPLHRAGSGQLAASSLSGIAKVGFMPSPLRLAVERNRPALGKVEHGPASAGYCYPTLVEGVADFVLFWRTLPWDHAPGTLIAREAGCHVARLDGRPYLPTVQTNERAQPPAGLLAAADPSTWLTAKNSLLGSSLG